MCKYQYVHLSLKGSHNVTKIIPKTEAESRSYCPQHAHDTIHTFREVCRSSEVFAFRTFTHEAYGLFCLCLSTTPNAQRKPNGQNVAKQIKGISIFLLILIADNLVLLGVACGSIKEVSEERLSANTTLCLESVCALLCSFFLSLPLAAFRPPCCSAVCPP